MSSFHAESARVAIRPAEDQFVVCFDVGYTLIDETRSWLAWASWLQVPPERLFDAFRESIARGESQPNRAALERLRPGLDIDEARTAIAGKAGASVFRLADLYPDVRPTLLQLRAAGFRLGAAGNMRIDTETLLRDTDLPLEFVGSSEGWGVAKPARGFFDRVIESAKTTANRITYVGDRVDNDVIPAIATGMNAVLIRRGLWAEARSSTEAPAAAITSLEELPALLAGWRTAPNTGGTSRE